MGTRGLSDECADGDPLRSAHQGLPTGRDMAARQTGSMATDQIEEFLTGTDLLAKQPQH